MVRILAVLPNSLASCAGICGGDELYTVNGQEIRDVLDYRFYLTDTSVCLSLKRGGKEYTTRIVKGEYEDIGLAFETPLMDKKHTCKNGCVFCFIDQLPPGMRESLYFKDDDDRLSFLHGNYVTLTNMTDADIDRIIKMHISPVNVSVHTTNPTLRVKMMKNKHAGEVLSYLGRLSKAGIALCTQIVLCKGLNDRDELTRTMQDLLAYYPSLRSCAIVPVGLTKYREKLYPLESFTKEDCERVLDQVEAFGNECFEKYGTRLFYCSDEFYLRAERPLPEDPFYEDYSQIENGVGMLTDLEAGFAFALDGMNIERDRPARTVSVATGVAAYEHIRTLANRLCARAPWLKVNVFRIVNRFFGESITVAGLLTGRDVAEQLATASLGDELLFPAVMLRADGDVFLDDMSPEELSRQLGVPVRAVKNEGDALLAALLGTASEE
ncbi:MAG: DUF512 domain-containing protein [Ruminococcaceae bacterium]|nr:DUF512 domain-containing protein [Oscillospiraceae bacterium]